MMNRNLWGSLALLLMIGGCEPSGGEVSLDAAPGPDPDVTATEDPGVAVEDTSAPDTGPPDVVVATFTPKEAAQYTVISADGLAAVAEDFAAYRRGQGMSSVVYTLSELRVGGVTATGDLVKRVQSVLQAGRDAFEPGTPQWLLILGDAPGAGEPVGDLIGVAPCASYYGGCYTDNAYGDLDGDGVPEVAVGRVPARDAAVASAYLERVKTHEASYQPGLWNRRIVLYTGEAGFGDSIDAVIEEAVMIALSKLNPAFDVIGAYDNPASAYYYTPFVPKVIELFNGGALMAAYIGHGSEDWTQGLPLDSLHQVHCEHRRPFAFFFACSNGNFAGPGTSVSEAALLEADGPITTFASADISHPYGNAVLPFEIQRMLLDHRFGTLGEALVAAKRAVIEHQDTIRDLMDGFAKLAGVADGELEPLRYQHLNLYNLLGDPAVAIAYPAVADALEVTAGTMEEGPLTVSGDCPGVGSGTAVVTLEIRRDEILGELAEIDPNKPDPETVQSNWQTAIDKAVTEVEVPIDGGHFEAVLATPDAPGSAPYFVKVYAHDGASDCFGSVEAP